MRRKNRHWHPRVSRCGINCERHCVKVQLLTNHFAPDQGAARVVNTARRHCGSLGHYAGVRGPSAGLSFLPPFFWPLTRPYISPSQISEGHGHQTIRAASQAIQGRALRRCDVATLRWARGGCQCRHAASRTPTRGSTTSCGCGATSKTSWYHISRATPMSPGLCETSRQRYGSIAVCCSNLGLGIN
jgi:hypothetical protein